MFHALVLEKNPEFGASVREVDDSFLPEGDVTVAIEYSTLNYKDALAITNRSPVVRSWPMVAGIDGSGTVLESSAPAWKPGDAVVLNGFGVGETHKGCLAGKARLKSEWLVRRPAAFSAKQAMAIGTAGYTAMLAVMALERHGLTPASGPAIVTGAAGGVGSVAVALLAKLGWRVIASTGRVEEEAYLKGLGAAEVIPRAELAGPVKPLAKERWAAGIDSVGSTTLANVLSMTRYGGAISACGLAGGMDLPASVAPFILRGVSLFGIDSVMCGVERRQAAWNRLESDLDRGKLQEMTSEIALDDVAEAGRRIVEGQVRGRIVVKIG